ATLGGTLTTAVSAGGVAAFSGLTLNRSGVGYTIRAEGAGLSAATTDPIGVVPGPAVQLVVMTQPPGLIAAGNEFGLALRAEDADGNLDPTFQGVVSLVLADHPAGAALVGNVTVRAKNGVALFSGLSLNKGGEAFRIQAAGAGLAAASTTSFGVTSP